MPSRGRRWTVAAAAVGVAAWVHDDQRGRLRAGEAVEDSRPEHRQRLGHVAADEEQAVGGVHVRVAARLAVGPERLAERLRRRGGAEAGVPVQVRRPDPGLGDEREGVVLLNEQLAGVVERHPAGGVPLDRLAALPGDERHRLVPARLAEPAVLADQRPGEAVGGGVRLPAVEPLRAEPAAVDAVGPEPADADDPAVLHADVERAPVGAEDARPADPLVRLFRDVLIHPGRPAPLAAVRGARAPHVQNAVAIVRHGRRPSVPPAASGVPRPRPPARGRSGRRGGAVTRRRPRATGTPRRAGPG